MCIRDRPTGALDTASGFEVMRLFRELIDDEDITIVMTTHEDVYKRQSLTMSARK